MKFCDKLQKIRKENNVTQEQLADKLDVSRQAVSKWESGTAYPDTEKLIQISKIFKVSLDELINDDVQVNKEKDISKKYNFVDTFNIVFEFISKSFSMFWAMKFKDKIKLLFEMAVLVLILILAGHITINIVTELIRRIFMFLPSRIATWIVTLANNILYVGCLVIGAIVVVKVFKTRYLDYYVVITDDTVEERVKEEPIKELKERKDYKVVIRDPEHSSRNFFKKIYEGFILILKVLAVIMAIPVMVTFVTAVMFFVISLGYAFSGLFFNGISLAILGGIVFIFLILEFMYNLIFNRKHAYLRGFIMFIVSLMMIGSGLGLSFTALNDFEIIDDNTLDGETETYTISMTDNLILHDIDDIDSERIVIDNSLKDIKLDIKTYGNADIEIYTHDVLDRENDYYQYRIVNLVYNYDDMKTFKNILKDAKNKKIRTYYDSSYYIDKLYISEENLTKLRENYKKLYD